MTIRDTVEFYKSNIAKYWSDEKYKWEAVKHFQDHWNIEADDFAGMLEESLSLAFNLLNGPMYFSHGMICGLTRQNPEKMRSLFRLLFDEKLSLVDRLQPFRDGCEELMDDFRKAADNPSKAKNHYQDLRALCVYLSFRYPEKYFLFKHKMYTEYKKKTGYVEHSTEKDSEIRKYDNYSRLCQDVIQEIRNDSDLLAIQRRLVENEANCYKDSEMHLLAQTIIYISKDMSADIPLTGEDGKGAAVADEDVETVHYWLYSPGEGAGIWNEYCKKGIMAIGWDEIGDLSQYASKKEMKQAMKTQYHSDKAFTMAAHATWQFANEMKPGDVVFAKKGRSTVIGRGVVQSDYEFDDSRSDNMNVREVNWTHQGEWPHPGQAAMKTLTDITSYTDYVEKLEALFESDEEDDVEPEEVSYPAYSKEKFLDEVYMDETSYDTLAGLVRHKKNVILQGAPGVGKTYAAKRLAYSIMGVKDPNRVMMVQFHQSYSYEDFIMGFRPSEKGFELKRGAFYNFCKDAEIDSENEYFFIIDEINRGNLSKIFGELFMLIESDKRGIALQLLYSDEKFSVPENVYIIGMMNTADRSLAMLDYALRRRFAFYEMKPGFASDGFRKYRANLNSARFDRLIHCVEQLNADIAEDETLGEGFCVGHSYFCNLKEGSEQALSRIVEFELIPLLKEYWFDEPMKVKNWAENLRSAVK